MGNNILTNRLSSLDKNIQLQDLNDVLKSIMNMCFGFLLNFCLFGLALFYLNLFCSFYNIVLKCINKMVLWKEKAPRIVSTRQSTGLGRKSNAFNWKNLRKRKLQIDIFFCSLTGETLTRCKRHIGFSRLLKGELKWRVTSIVLGNN